MYVVPLPSMIEGGETRMSEGQQLKHTDVLLVEDEIEVHKLISEVLQSEGYAVLVAATIDEGLAHLESARPWGLVITDFRLGPKEETRTGADIVRAAQRKGIPCFVITGYAIPDVIRVCRELRVFLLRKPFGIDACLRVVERCLQDARRGVADAVRERLES